MNEMSIDTTQATTHSWEEIWEWTRAYCSKLLSIPENDIKSSSRPDEISLDSAMLTALIIDLEAWLKVDVPMSVFFENENFEDISKSIEDLAKA